MKFNPLADKRDELYVSLHVMHLISGCWFAKFFIKRNEGQCQKA